MWCKYGWCTKTNVLRNPVKYNPNVAKQRIHVSFVPAPFSAKLCSCIGGEYYHCEAEVEEVQSEIV